MEFREIFTYSEYIKSFVEYVICKYCFPCILSFHPVKCLLRAKINFEESSWYFFFFLFFKDDLFESENEQGERQRKREGEKQTPRCVGTAVGLNPMTLRSGPEPKLKSQTLN